MANGSPPSDRLSQLTKLQQADPTDAFLAYGIALEHGKAGRFDEALHWLDRTLAIDPRYCYAFFQKAKMLMETGGEDAARGVLDAGMRTALQAGDTHAHAEMQALLESLG